MVAAGTLSSTDSLPAAGILYTTKIWTLMSTVLFNDVWVLLHCVAVEVANEDSDAMVIESDENDSTQVVNIFTQILLRSTYCLEVFYAWI